MPYFLLAASLLLAVLSAWWPARAFAPHFPGRFFLFTILFALQPGLFAQLLSPFPALTPWPWLGLQMLLCSGLYFWLQPQWEAPALAPPRFPLPVVAAAALIAVLAAANITLTALAPIHTWDEKMYHAARAAYWLQHHSLAFWPTANERQTALSFQGELFFFWPLLFTRLEAPGRVLAGLGYPLAVAAVWLLARRLKAAPTVAAAGAALYAATPLGLFLARYLKPDHWAVLFACALAFWLLEALEPEPGLEPEAPPIAPLFWAGIALALCIHTRLYALALLPAVCFLARRNPRPFAAGLLSGSAASGLLFLFLSNWNWYGSPSGPAAMRTFYASQPSEWTTIARRAPLLFTDSPGAAPLQRAWIQLSGADRPLRGETAAVRWPGLYQPAPTWPPSRFAAAGLFALAGLFLAWRRPQRPVWLCGAALLFGPIFTLRWITADEIPDRFLLPAVALLLAAILTRLPRWSAWPLLALALLGAWAPARETAMLVRMWWLMPPSMSVDNTPFSEAVRILPEDARVLLIGMQITQDYPLFGTRTGYRREIYSWGRGPWDPARFHQLLAAHRITHVLLEDDQTLAFHWDAPVDARPVAAGLDAVPELQRLPLQAGHQRLYAWRPH